LSIDRTKKVKKIVLQVKKIPGDWSEKEKDRIVRLCFLSNYKVLYWRNSFINRGDLSVKKIIPPSRAEDGKEGAGRRGRNSWLS